jgi:aryl-alcohol dehydrogenase-like predicted oxidoreductase
MTYPRVRARLGHRVSHRRQVSLAWLLSRPTVASAVVGAETVEKITANATAADVILEQAQLDALTALQAGDNEQRRLTANHRSPWRSGPDLLT